MVGVGRQVRMSEKELNQIIAVNISRLLDQQGKSQFDLADYVGVSQSAVSNWCKGKKTPRMSKIDKICEFFGVNRSDILEEHEGGYYVNDGVAEIVQALLDNPNMKVLFDAAKGSKVEDIHMAADLLERLKKTNPDG